MLHACASTFVQLAFYPLTTELLPPRLRSSWLGVVYAAAPALAEGSTERPPKAALMAGAAAKPLLYSAL